MVTFGDATRDLFTPGLGETQRHILLALKERGPATVTDLAAELGLAATTLRGHLQSLVSEGLVARQGSKRGKRGRPDVVFALGPEGQRLFPRQEGEVLRELIQHLDAGGRQEVLEEFFAARVAARRERLLPRVAGLAGVARLREVARILSEEGFMARVALGPDGAATLQLCHCPISGVIAETRVPCRYEEALLAELLGSPLTRTAYMPTGGTTCSYVECGQQAAPTTQESL